ncbi:helix-turn-helix domain-containing protein [Aquimarina sediminis]|uniref:hypothetical protein n=1 Tax=Aquimarina sediminis TaxID=2070536 RepID=UPI000FFF5314|nr:hypothetical protein [Aquimarina sediminis]
MNVIIKHIELIERIDQLIRMQATGTPAELATKLGVSRTKLYRLIKMMKSLNAPVQYNIALQSYVYEEAVGFRFGFFTKETKVRELHPIVG